MDRIGSGEAAVERVAAKAMAGDARSRLRSTLAAILPSFIAFLAESLFWAASVRWSLFYLAVFVSSWLGGFRSGVSATMISTALMWWFFAPPRHVLIKSDPRHYFAAGIFILMGFVISGLHRKLRRSARELAMALVASREMTERLRRAVDERRVFAALIENSSDFIAIADPDGKPIYLNPAGRQLVGLSPTFPVKTVDREDFYPLGLRAVPEIISKDIFESGRWGGESRLRHWQSGHSIPVSETEFLIRDLETNRVLGIGTITRDMSEAKRQRDELREANRRLSEASRDLTRSQRFLQAILDHSPNGIIIKDLNGRYLVINKGLESLTGVSAVEALGKTDFDLFPRGVAERFRSNDRIVHDTRAPLITEEKTQLSNDGRVFLVTKFPLLDNHQGAVFAICAIWTDITDRKRTEEELRQSMRDLGTAQHVAHVGSWRWDLRNNSIVWSEELYRIFGRDPQSPPPPLLSPEQSVFTQESAMRLRAAVDKLHATGEPYEVDLEIVRPDGSTGWVFARGEAVRDDDGELIGINGTAADITHVRALQRLRDEWTSVIAHDLRQPIGIIAMASDFLPAIHAGDMNEKERAFMERLRSAGQSLARMVDDLLDMSLLDAHRLKLERNWIDPRVLVGDAVERLSHVTGNGRVKVCEGRRLAKVYVDPMRIDQVLGNLITNAVKYGDRDRHIIVRLERHDSEVDVSVTNHGPGITPEELPRLFDRFARSKTASGSGIPGLGLGLYISKGVVEAHGGRIWAESTPAKTTTFHITLPTAVAAQVAA